MSDWTPSEKKLARVLYDRALVLAKEEVMAKYRGLTIENVGDLWELPEKIKDWGNDLDHIFRYAYSRLDEVFYLCIRRGWLSLEDMSGFSPERYEWFEKAMTKD